MILASGPGMLDKVLSRSATPLLFALVLAAGCSRSTSRRDPLNDALDVRDWANRASAVGVWTRINDVVAAGDGRDPFRDPECPTIEEASSTVTIQGGCTANDDQIWTGSATVTNLGAEDEDIVIDAFGHSEDPGLVAELSGTVAIRGLADGSHSFALDLTNDAPFEGVMTIDYEGVVEGGWTGPTTWNGAGTVELEGASVAAETVDQVWDPSVCQGAAASGETTLTSAEHVAVITYDGAVDCDEDERALWRQDGIDRGTIAGISCSAAGWRGQPGLGAVALALVGLALALRRRRAR